MAPRPLIFISAVSKELKSARQLVSTTLQYLGYEPVWQDVFGTEEGDLREMLRKKIDDSKGVIQLVGQCYGAEPRKPDETFGRVSYTQYEALYAKQRGKKVWYLFLDDNFPRDPHADEPEELRELQAAYRRRLRSESQLYYTLSNREALESSILKLRKDFEAYKRRWKIWATAVLVLLVLLCIGVAYVALELKAVVKFAEARNDIRQEQPNGTVSDDAVYARLGKQLGIDPVLLKKTLPTFAKMLKDTPIASDYRLANAAYITRDYAGAERLALAAADQAQQVMPPDAAAAIKALQLAGYAADARTNDIATKYADALSHYRAAQQLVDRASDPLDWATLQRNIAFVLDEQGQYDAAEQAYRDALQAFQNVPSTEGKDMLVLSNNLAIALYQQGKYGNAEATLREVVDAARRTLDANDPVLLLSRMSLGNVLLVEGKYPDAEEVYQQVVPLEEQVFGPANGRTLATRNNLAIVLLDEGKYADAGKELQDLTTLETTALGPEHLYTLATRDTLALAFLGEGKFADAEKESRAVLALREKILGSNHPDTINSQNNLAHALNEEGKYPEAESLSREILNLNSSVLKMDHPYRVESHHNLAVALAGEGKFDEAETEFWETINLRESVLGHLHPDTFSTYYRFALCLKAEGKTDEAKKFAQEAAGGAEKILGPTHPDTQKYEKLLSELP